MRPAGRICPGGTGAVRLGRARRGLLTAQAGMPPCGLLFLLSLCVGVRRHGERQAVVAVEIGEVLHDLVAHDDLLDRKVPLQTGLAARLDVECDRAAPDEMVRSE